MPSDQGRAEEADFIAARAKMKVVEQRDRLAQANPDEKAVEERLLDIMRHNSSVADLVKSLTSDEP